MSVTESPRYSWMLLGQSVFSLVKSATTAMPEEFRPCANLKAISTSPAARFSCQEAVSKLAAFVCSARAPETAKRPKQRKHAQAKLFHGGPPVRLLHFGWQQCSTRGTRSAATAPMETTAKGSVIEPLTKSLQAADDVPGFGNSAAKWPSVSTQPEASYCCTHGPSSATIGSTASGGKASMPPNATVAPPEGAPHGMSHGHVRAQARAWALTRTPRGCAGKRRASRGLA
mmetsp:Transcript_86765/g.221050  ORF Transcript_86765/g.221050 Transcript_86765/m.221050 type:complete len:229 (-) Transcript_86765:6-692(-)